MRYGKGKNWLSLNLRYRNTELTTTNLWATENAEVSRKFDNFLYNATLNIASSGKHSLRMSLNS